MHWFAAEDRRLRDLEINSLQMQLQQAITSHNEALEHERENLLSAFELTLRQRIETNSQRESELSKQISSMDIRLSELRSENSRLTSELSIIQHENITMEATLAEKMLDLGKVRQQYEDIQMKLQQMNDAHSREREEWLLSLNKERSVFHDQLQEIQNALHSSKIEMESERRLRKVAEESSSEIRIKLHEIQQGKSSEVTNLHLYLLETQIKLKRAESELEETLTNNVQLQEKITKLELNYKNLLKHQQQTLNELTTTQKSLQEMVNKNSELAEALTSEQRSCNAYLSEIDKLNIRLNETSVIRDLAEEKEEKRRLESVLQAKEIEIQQLLQEKNEMVKIKHDMKQLQVNNSNIIQTAHSNNTNILQEEKEEQIEFDNTSDDLPLLSIPVTPTFDTERISSRNKHFFSDPSSSIQLTKVS
jgi:hypothetical protein